MLGWLSSSRSFTPCAPDDAGTKLLVKLLAHRQMFGLTVSVLKRKFAAGSKENVSMVVLFPHHKALSHPQGLHLQIMHRVRERERKNFTERKKRKKKKTKTVRHIHTGVACSK